MANLLRLSRAFFSSKFHLSQAARVLTNVSADTTRRIPWFLSRQLATTPVQHLADPSQSQTSSTLTVDDHIVELDNQVRRWGRIDREQIGEILNLVKKQGNVTQRQGLVLLRSTGSLLVKETPETRNKIFQDVWDQLVALGLSMGTAEHNAALRVQLENEQKVSVADFLEGLGDCKPNRVTYQLMVARYCDEGDIESASKILEHMKKEDVPLTEAIFNQMVKGYMKRSDVASAEEVINTMRTMKIYPTCMTYRALMCGHAETGNLDGIKKTLMSAQQDEVFIHPRQFFDAAFKLATSGHSQHIKELLSLMPTTAAYNHDAINMVYQMSACGHLEEAMLVYDAIQGDLKYMSGLHRSILKKLVEHKQPLDKILKVWQKFDCDTQFKEGLAFLSFNLSQYNQPEKALEVLKLQNEKGVEAKPYYFWSHFSRYSKEKDVEGMYQTLNVLVECAGDRIEDFLPTICINCAKSLQNLGESVDAVVARCKEYGVPDNICNAIVSQDLLNEGKFQEAISHLEKEGSRLPILLLRESFNGYKQNADPDGLAKVMTMHGVKNNLADVNGSVLDNLLKIPSMDRTQAEALISAWKNNKLRILDRYLADILQRLNELEVSSETVQSANALVASTVRARPQNPSSPGKPLSTMTQANLEKELATEIEEGRNTSAVRKYLLQKYCQTGEIAKAEALKAELDSENFIYGRDTLRQLALLSSRYKKDLEETNSYLALLEKDHPEFLSYSNVMLNRAILQIQNGLVEEACADLEKFLGKWQKLDIEPKLAQDYTAAENCGALLRACRASDSCTPDTTWKLGNLLMGSFVKKGTYSLLKEMVSAYVDKEDAEGAVNALKYCAENFQRTPNHDLVFQLLIKNEDANRLQKAVDLVMSISDHNEVLLSLVVDFIKFDKIKQARNLLETPQLRIRMTNLRKLCERLFITDQEDVLKQFIEVTRGHITGNMRDEMLFQLIRIHVKKSNFEAAEKVLVQYEEESELPSPRTLRYLEMVLKGADRPVNFEVPESKVSPSDGKILRAMKDRKGFEALEELKGLYPEGKTMAPDMVNEAVGILLRTRQQTVLNRLISFLAENGDEAALTSVTSGEQQLRLQSTVKKAIMQASLKNGTISEFIEKFNEDASKLGEYTTTLLLQDLRQQAPEVFGKVEGMILKKLETTETVAQNLAGLHLFTMYMMNGEYDKAEKILMVAPAMKDINTRYIMNKMAADKDEAGVLKLKEWFQTVRPPRIFFDKLIFIRVANEDYDGALKYVEEANASGVAVSDLWATPLVTLEEKLTSEGRAVPWEKGTLQPNKNRRDVDRGSSSDSSDSSDSDEEHTATSKGN